MCVSTVAPLQRCKQGILIGWIHIACFLSCANVRATLVAPAPEAYGVHLALNVLCDVIVAGGSTASLAAALAAADSDPT